MIRPTILTLALAAVLLAGCGNDERDQAAAAAGPAPTTDADDHQGPSSGRQGRRSRKA